MSKSTFLCVLLAAGVLYLTIHPFLSLAINSTHTLIKISLASCLPSSLTLQQHVSNDGKKIVTIHDVLQKVGAYCSLDKQLYTNRGRQLYFYHLQQCKKEYARNTGEKIGQQDKEIQQLNLNYFVVQIACQENS